MEQIRDYRRWLIVAVVVLIVLNIISFSLWGYLALTEAPRVNLSNLEVIGPTKLCPGDTLNYKFDMDISAALDIVITMRVQYISPDSHGQGVPHTIFVTEEQYRADSPARITLVRHNRIEPFYIDQNDGNLHPRLPGDYLRIISARVYGQTEDGDFLAIPYTIPMNCPIGEQR